MAYSDHRASAGLLQKRCDWQGASARCEITTVAALDPAKAPWPRHSIGDTLMPWTSRSFAKHSKKARGKAGRGAAEAANKALASGKSEGAAVRIGNYVARRVAAKRGRRSGRRSSRT